MKLRGRIQNGVVVLEGAPALPDGTAVTVLCPEGSEGEPGKQQRVALPLVPSEHPGSVRLTAERVAELLEDADVSS